MKKILVDGIDIAPLWRESYTFQELIKHYRELNDITLEQASLITGLSIEDYKEFEEGTKPIERNSLSKLLLRFEIRSLPPKINRVLLKMAENSNKSPFAKKITELRMKNKMSQRQVSDILKIAQTTYAGYETGNHEPSMKILIDIANLYDVPIDILVGRYKQS